MGSRSTVADGRVTAPTSMPEVICPYQYWARVVRIVDGDTVDLEVSVGFELSMKARFRLLGVDAPEMFGVRHTSDEYTRGVAARDCLQALAPPDSWVEIRTYLSANREKYGRYLCNMYVDGRDLAEQLVAAGVAKPWE
jgi:micrococcal nuclease